MLQHLAANGRSTVVKGCRNDNKGWRRSPLGGNNGMQWYLWWTPASGAAATGLDAPEDAILIRDVRQHDDHSTLKAGKAGRLPDHHPSRRADRGHRRRALDR